MSPPPPPMISSSSLMKEFFRSEPLLLHLLWEGPFDLEVDLDLHDDDDLNEFLSGKLSFVVAEEHAHSPCLLFGGVADGGWCAGGVCVAGLRYSPRGQFGRGRNGHKE